MQIRSCGVLFCSLNSCSGPAEEITNATTGTIYQRNLLCILAVQVWGH